jgi:hypothetical protein
MSLYTFEYTPDKNGIEFTKESNPNDTFTIEKGKSYTFTPKAGSYGSAIRAMVDSITSNESDDTIPKNIHYKPYSLEHDLYSTASLPKGDSNRFMSVLSLTGSDVKPQYNVKPFDTSKFNVKQFGGRSKRYRKSKKYSKTKSKSRTRRGGRRSRRMRRVKCKSRR